MADRGEVAPPPEAHARLHLLLLLAIDRDKNWTLVRDDHDVRWWVLGNPLPCASVPEDSAGVLWLAAVWLRRRL